MLDCLFKNPQQLMRVTNNQIISAMDLKELQQEAFVFIAKKDEYAEIIPDGNIDKAAELFAEFVHHLWECGMEYTPDTGKRQSNIPVVSGSAFKSDETIHYEALKDCCNKLLDEVEKGNTPRRQLTGLKLLLNR